MARPANDRAAGSNWMLLINVNGLILLNKRIDMYKVEIYKDGFIWAQSDESSFRRDCDIINKHTNLPPYTKDANYYPRAMFLVDQISDICPQARKFFSESTWTKMF